MQQVYIVTANPPKDTYVEFVQRQMNNIRRSLLHNLPEVAENGLYDDKMAKAVKAFQQSCNIGVDGKFGPQTRMCLVQKMRESSHLATTAQISHPGQSLLMDGTYTVGSNTLKEVYKVDNYVNPSEKGLAYILKEWEKVLSEQYQGLMRRLNRFPAKKAMRLRNVMHQMDRCQKFLNKASQYGIVSATKEFGEKLTKDEAIRCIKELGALMENSSLTKGLSAVNRLLSKVKNIINPMLKILNKIPGLKYYSVVEKIVKATKTMIQGDYANAFALYMDGLRELIEQLLIGAAIAALVAIGGWAALTVAVVLVILALIVDYFFFSDNPGESLSDQWFGKRTRNIMLENAPETYRIITNRNY